MTVHLPLAADVQVISPAIAVKSSHSGGFVKEFDFQAGGFSKHIYALNPFCHSW